MEPAICADLYGDSGEVLVTVKPPEEKKKVNHVVYHASPEP